MNLSTVFRTFKNRSLFSAGLAGIFLVVAGSGCQSTSGGNSFASVTINNRSAEEIQSATAQVFAEDGYRGGPTGSGGMVFEKLASRGTSISREGLVGAAYGAQTINRVRVDILQLAEGKHILECKAFMVTGGSDPFFQNEVPLTGLRSGPYQSLLNKVAKKLNSEAREK